MMQLTQPAASRATPASAQYLTFLCDGEEYGVDIRRVQEVKGWDGVTRVPHTPPCVLGVMNLRGVIVPVINLRARFGLEVRAFDARTVVIVVRIQGPRGEKTSGVVVDGVSEVYALAAEAVRPVPDLGGRADAACISGVTMIGEKMVMILAIDDLINSSIDSQSNQAGGLGR